MIPLTPEQIEYKEKTLNQLLINMPLLESKFRAENRPEVRVSLEKQIDEMQAHIEHLQNELAQGMAGEPIADELCQKIAQALVKEKYYMARKYLSRLETIEPFYPNLDRLRVEVEAERAGRRTRSIAQGAALPYGAVALPAAIPVEGVVIGPATLGELPAQIRPVAKPRRSFAQYFQFHIVASCLIVLLIVCVMLAVGGMSVLQWLIEGG
jgi:hypothetical protein